jgi:hypothetical protein
MGVTALVAMTRTHSGRPDRVPSDLLPGDPFGLPTPTPLKCSYPPHTITVYSFPVSSHNQDSGLLNMLIPPITGDSWSKNIWFALGSINGQMS